MNDREGSGRIVFDPNVQEAIDSCALRNAKYARCYCGSLLPDMLVPVERARSLIVA